MAKYINADEMIADENEAYLSAQCKITDKVTRDINFVVHTKLQRLLADAPAAEVKEVIRCKECKYFNLNKWGKVNDIPLIVAHEICDFWGEGCKTDKDAYCSFAERRG